MSRTAHPNPRNKIILKTLIQVCVNWGRLSLYAAIFLLCCFQLSKFLGQTKLTRNQTVEFCFVLGFVENVLTTGSKNNWWGKKFWIQGKGENFGFGEKYLKC